MAISLPNRVVCAIDAQMTYALTVLLGAMARTAKHEFRVTVGYLDDMLPPVDRNVVSEVASALRIPLDFMPLPSHSLFITQGHISPTTFAKFLLADAIGEPHLWLDADTVVLPGWDAVFSEISKTSEAEGLVVSARGGGIQSEKGMAFNAGVLGWPAGPRRDWETPLQSLEKVETQEQFLFNTLYAPSARVMSEKFNTLTYRVEKLDPENLPFIIHFAGAHKPWHLRRDLSHHCRNYCCPWSQWFLAEEALLKEIGDCPVRPQLETQGSHALVASHLTGGPDQRGLRLLRLLLRLGPIAPIAVWLLRLLKQWIARGTHPIH